MPEELKRQEEETSVKNIETSEELLKLEDLYRQLGKAYYEGRFEDPLPELLGLFDQITRIRNKQQEKVERMFCPNCGREMKQKINFCGNCGYKLK